MMVPLWGIAIAAGVILLAYLLYRFMAAVQDIQKSAQRTAELAQAVKSAFDADVVVSQNLQKSIDAATAKLEELRKTLEPLATVVPDMMTTVAKIGTAQLEIMKAQRTPFGRTSIPQRDVEAANLEEDVQRAMRAEGISREEAMLRMNPANTRSVWENNEIFRGW